MELTGGEHIFLSSVIFAAGDIRTLNDEEISDEQERPKAIILSRCADESRYGKLLQNLKEAAYVDRDEYPTSIATMYELITKTNGSLQGSGNNNATSNRSRPGIMLVQQQCSEVNEDLVPGNDGCTFDIICYNCNKRGHYASNCPEEST